MAVIGDNTYTAVPTAIINGCSDGGGVLVGLSDNNTKQILSGALTADTYKSLLSISGRGVISRLHAYAIDGTARTITLKITINGTVVFEAVSGALSLANTGIFGIGDAGYSGYSTGLQPVPFSTSLDVSVKSSVTETDKVAISILYVTM